MVQADRQPPMDLAWAGDAGDVEACSAGLLARNVVAAALRKDPERVKAA